MNNPTRMLIFLIKTYVGAQDMWEYPSTPGKSIDENNWCTISTQILRFSYVDEEVFNSAHPVPLMYFSYDYIALCCTTVRICNTVSVGRQV